STRTARPASTPAHCARSTAAPPPSALRCGRIRMRATCSSACKASTRSDWTCRGACPHPLPQPDGATAMSFRILLPLLLAALPAAALATTPIDETRPLNADGKVEISNLKGSIQVRVWDKPEVHVGGSLGRGVDTFELRGDRDEL